MSGLVTGLVLKYAPVESKHHLLVLVTLAECASDDGTGAFPAVDTIAERSRGKRRNTQYALRDLEAQGLIESQGVTRQGTTIWRVCIERLATVVRPPARGGATTAPLSQNAPLGVQPVAPKPSLVTALNRQDLETDGSPNAGEGAISAGWAATLDLLRDRLPAHKFAAMVEPLQLCATEGKHLVVAAPPHTLTAVRERYGPMIVEAAREAIDKQVTVEISLAAVAA